MLWEEAVFSQNVVNGTDIRVPRNVFFCFPNAVWASVSGAFYIVPDTLVAVV